MMHSWGNSCSLPIAFCKRGAERPELAALMLRQSSGSAAQWASPFNTSRADSVTSVQGLRGSETLGLWSRSSGCLVSVSFQSLVVCSKAGPRLWPWPCGDFPIAVSCPGRFLAQAEVALVEGFHANYSAFLLLDLLVFTLICGVSEPLMGTFCPQILVPLSPRAAAT